MGPETGYQRNGDMGYVVFPCGYTIGEDNDGIKLYYGAAGTSIGLAHGSIREMPTWLKQNPFISREPVLDTERRITISYNYSEMYF